ncbi:MAG: integron integrase [Gemmataceae bacterium]|nr:integron integrase [Gemmataceae bacterium]
MPPSSGPKLLDRVRAACRVRHDSIRTEDAYHDWVKRFVLFHQKRHPLDMAEPEVNAFLTDPAVTRQVAASTQNRRCAPSCSCMARSSTARWTSSKSSGRTGRSGSRSFSPGRRSRESSPS